MFQTPRCLIRIVILLLSNVDKVFMPFVKNGVASFQGRSLSVLNSTNMRVNPMEVKEAYNLRGW